MEDDLKKQWNDTRFRGPDPESIDNALLGRKKTALQNLERRYRQFSVMSLVAISFCILFARLMPEDNRLLFMILMAVYFFTASMMDLWLSNGISKIDCSTMRVSEVAKKVMLYRKRHFQFMAILIPAALGLIIFMMWGNREIIGGAVVGALLGAGLGIRAFREFMKDYREVLG